MSAYVTHKSMRSSKYTSSLAPLLEKPFFTTFDASLVNIPSRMLSYFCDHEIIERISPGVFRGKESSRELDFDLEELIITAATIPKGVICLISALYIYGLTDQIMREHWIAVPNEVRAPKRDFIRVVRMRNTTLGKTSKTISGIEVSIFDKERTIVDAFRFLSDEIAIKALKEYLSPSAKEKPNLTKLFAYGKALRVKIHPYIMALTT